jgi:hypothetical protein
MTDDGRVLIRTPLRISPELHAELRAISFLLGVSLNECGNHALRRWVREIYKERPSLRKEVDKVIVRAPKEAS